MSDDVVVKRIEDVYQDRAFEDVECLGCRRTIGLWFNGGELDVKRCCGYVYRGEHARIDIVITKAATP